MDAIIMNYHYDFDALLVLSVVLQVILTLLGSFRKRCSEKWFTFLVWSTYQLANVVAITALGMITTDSDSDHVYAFWSAFLLVHLGGPDSITALALVDNQLSLRNLFHLVYQVGVAAYIVLKQVAHVEGVFFQIDAMFVFFGGFSKYGERIWAFHSANLANLRDSMLPPPNPGPCLEIVKDDHDDHHINVADAHDHTNSMPMLPLNHVDSTHHAHSIPMPRSMDESASRTATTLQPAPTPAPVEEALSVEQLDSDHQAILLLGYRYFCNFKCLFVDLMVPYSHRTDSQRFFLRCPYGIAFQLIDVELSLMYDMLFTKAPVVCTWPAYFIRWYRIGMEFESLIKYSSSLKASFLFNPFLWALVQEVYEFIQMLFSERAVIWINDRLNDKQLSMRILRVIVSCRLLVPKIICFCSCGVKKVEDSETTIWWSNNNMAQYDLLSNCFEDRPTMFERILGILPWGSGKSIQDWLENNRITTYLRVSDDIKDVIYKQFKEMVHQTSEEEIRSAEFRNFRGKRVMRLNNCLEKVGWSVDGEFDQSILIWHVATEFCYYYDDFSSNEYKSGAPLHVQVSKALSNYLLYLLIMFPSMLNSNNGNIRFQDTCETIKRLIDVPKEHDKSKPFSFILQRKNSSALDERRAKSFILRLVRSNDQVVTEKKLEESNSVLLEAHRLAKLLLSYAREERWKIISDVWVEMLSYAARNCSGMHHAERLCDGGEFLTKIWLLMAHLGMVG